MAIRRSSRPGHGPAEVDPRPAAPSAGRLIRVEGGSPTDEELAVLLTVLLAPASMAFAQSGFRPARRSAPVATRRPWTEPYPPYSSPISWQRRGAPAAGRPWLPANPARPDTSIPRIRVSDVSGRS
ncbi:MAG: acyl-CoA carboxylase epsilon subunit [Trebonia sp.]